MSSTKWLRSPSTLPLALEKREPEFRGTMEGAPMVWPWWREVDVGVKTLEGKVEGKEEGKEKSKL